MIDHVQKSHITSKKFNGNHQSQDRGFITSSMKTYQLKECKSKDYSRKMIDILPKLK